jgi:type IV pilus assembly protein PilV
VIARLHRSRRGNQRGISLIEVMVGVVLMTIGILGLAALSVTVAQANRGATNRTRADQVLHEKIEEFQTADYDVIADGTDTITVGGIAFERTWTVTDDTPMDGVKKIEIVGTWGERGSTFQSRRMTYIAESGR